MNLNLQGKLCVLTGCFGGLGRAIGAALAGEGARLIASDRQSESEGRKMAAEAFGNGVAYRRCDVTDRASVDALFADIVPDVAIANAGVTHSHSILDLPEEEWRRVLDTNLTGSFLFAQAAARRMKISGGGSIVMIGSWVQDFPLSNTAAYTVSKSGLKMLMKNMALELGPFGVRVNLVAPGNFNAGMAQSQMEKEPTRRASAESRVALGRFGEARELADAVLFMASERASYITGSTLLVDGGNSLGKRA